MPCPVPFFVTKSTTINCGDGKYSKAEVKAAWIKLATAIYADAVMKCRAGGGNCIPGDAELTVDSPKIEFISGQPGKCSFEISMYISCIEPPEYNFWGVVRIIAKSIVKGLAVAAACFVAVYGAVFVGPMLAKRMQEDPEFAENVREFAKEFSRAGR